MTPAAPQAESAGAQQRPRPYTIAIMQPYFVPYAGYFRLFAASDLFVIYDCVQFPRRGWVHRNQLVDRFGRQRWLTLPLLKAPRDVLIRDLRFQANASALIAERLRPFEPLRSDNDSAHRVVTALQEVRGTPVDYIERILEAIVAYLDFPWNVIRSSSLGISPSLRGQDRILAIAREFGAQRYINAPGGRDLYDARRFADAGIELRFLPHYDGLQTSILRRLLIEDRTSLLADIKPVIAG